MRGLALSCRPWGAATSPWPRGRSCCRIISSPAGVVDPTWFNSRQAVSGHADGPPEPVSPGNKLSSYEALAPAWRHRLRAPGGLSSNGDSSVMVMADNPAIRSNRLQPAALLRNAGPGCFARFQPTGQQSRILSALLPVGSGLARPGPVCAPVWSMSTLIRLLMAASGKLPLAVSALEQSAVAGAVPRHWRDGAPLASHLLSVSDALARVYSPGSEVRGHAVRKAKVEQRQRLICCQGIHHHHRLVEGSCQKVRR